MRFADAEFNWYSIQIGVRFAQKQSKRCRTPNDFKQLEIEYGNRSVRSRSVAMKVRLSVIECPNRLWWPLVAFLVVCQRRWSLSFPFCVRDRVVARTRVWLRHHRIVCRRRRGD